MLFSGLFSRSPSGLAHSPTRSRPFSRRLWVGRVRVFARRWQLGRRGAAAALALFAAWSVYASQARADEAIDGLGQTRAVVVASDELGFGHLIEPGDLHVEARPRAHIPASAIDASDSIDGRVVTSPIGRGEIVTSARLSGAGSSGVAARLPRDTRGVAIDISAVTVALEPGNRVDLATVDDLGESILLAADLLVVAVSETQVTVAVPARTATAVATAAGRRDVSIAVRAGS